MAEVISTPRLMAAAKEFNIGKDTLVDFLVGKGFDKDELKPTAKLSEDMYRALQNEFQSDKAAKMKAVQIDLPKNAAGEPKKKRDEEEIHFRKEEKKPAKKEEPVVIAEQEVAIEVLPPQPEVIEEMKVPEPEVVQPPSVPAEPVIEIQEQQPVAPQEPELTKADIPEIEAPKVLDKIDLSTIDSSTRPKKGVKKAKPAPEKVKVEESVPEPVEEAVIPEEVIEPVLKYQ